MLTYICLQYRVATELPYRHKNVYGAEEKGNSFAISPSLRLSTPVFLLRFVCKFLCCSDFPRQFPAAHLQKTVFTVFIAFFKFIVNSAAQADLSKPRPPSKTAVIWADKKNEADFRLRSILTSVLIKKDLLPTWAIIYI